jgi:hypothetical protein
MKLNWLQDTFIFNIFCKIFFNLSDEFKAEMMSKIKELDAFATARPDLSDRLFVNFLFKFARSVNNDLTFSLGDDSPFSPVKPFSFNPLK